MDAIEIRVSLAKEVIMEAREAGWSFDWPVIMFLINEAYKDPKMLEELEKISDGILEEWLGPRDPNALSSFLSFVSA